MAEREVVRCVHCTLNQFVTAKRLCRRCNKSVDKEPEAPKVVLPHPLAMRSGSLCRVPVAKGPAWATATHAVRTSVGISQRALALRMGVPRTYISKVENGKVEPTIPTLRKIVAALDVPLAGFVTFAVALGNAA